MMRAELLNNRKSQRQEQGKINTEICCKVWYDSVRILFLQRKVMNRKIRSRKYDDRNYRG